jgi:PmbA protein
MEELLKAALEEADEAEVYEADSTGGRLTIDNSKVTGSDTSIRTGYALRIIRNGRLGSAYTRNLTDRKRLVTNAMASLRGDVEVGFSFPPQGSFPDPEACDGSVSDMGPTDLARMSSNVVEHLAGRTDGQINVYASYSTNRVRIVNSSGLDASQVWSRVSLASSILFPNTATSVTKIFRFRGPRDVPKELLDDQLRTYDAGLPLVDAPSGRMKVLLMPGSMFGFVWRLVAGASGRSMHNGTSPLLGRQGERVISEKLTFYDDPLEEGSVGTRVFDDEGVATGRLPIYDKGVFRNILVDLDYAARLNQEPSGSGFRGSFFGGDAITSSPGPMVCQPRIEPGQTGFEEMVSSMDRGVIALSALGAHSGNIINGDISIGLNPGYYVENGEIRGRVRDGMVAGNVYDMLRNVVTVEDKVHDPYGYWRFPCVLIDSVRVSAKGS